MDQFGWLRLSAVVVLCGLCVAVWKWSAITAIGPDELSEWAEPYRHAWYALPVVMLGFVVLGPLPVLLLITATGVVFGPVLGPIYAMAGSLASASTGFAIGRWLGLTRVERLGGERVRRIARALHRNGTLAVFLVRKVPAPFMLANIVIGASPVRYADLLVGTLLGMGAIVVALAGFGPQFLHALRQPSPATLSAAALFVAVPLTLAWIVNRTLRRSRPAE